MVLPCMPRLFSVDSLIFCSASNQATWPCIMYADPRAGGEGVSVRSLGLLLLLFVKERTMFEECRFVQFCVSELDGHGTHSQ